MSVSRHHIAEIVGKKTMKSANTKKLVQEVAAYLIAENRERDIDSLMRDIMLYRAQSGIVETTAVSAFQLSTEVKAEIKKLVKREFPHTKQVLLHEEIDPSVVGGVRIEFPEEQLDLTVKTKLNTFKRLTAEERI